MQAYQTDKVVGLTDELLRGAKGKRLLYQQPTIHGAKVVQGRGDALLGSLTFAPMPRIVRRVLGNA
jgi:hypothetical protein